MQDLINTETFKKTMIKMSEEVKSTLISFYKDYIKFLGSIIYKTYYQESWHVWNIYMKNIFKTNQPEVLFRACRVVTRMH